MTSNYSRKKRITDPFDDEAKARFFGLFEPGSVSSGSEHSSHKFDEDNASSPSLSNLMYGVLLDNETVMPADSKSSEQLDYDSAGAIHELKLILAREKHSDKFKDVLRANVLKATDLFPCSEINNNSSLRRNVMSYLRNLGYNAAICKTKWETCGGLNAGNYEFIDVVRSVSSGSISIRYFIDVDFVSEFQLARPTNSYEEILKALPKVFVDKDEELKQILRVVSDGGRWSLKSSGLIIPPWRKHRFMQQKYFGPFKRTINVFPAAFGYVPPCNKVVAVKCRALGFGDGDGNGRLFPEATRTR
ncbi:hypothetical protein LIER_22350 [Lithospermum erythrorhizon]|uniref:Uncharacterized protein n=1 Tax=Lithospermum erythrorhizon TaxID=34254 RepID=A0AAV3QUT5_LITER